MSMRLICFMITPSPIVEKRIRYADEAVIEKLLCVLFLSFAEPQNDYCRPFVSHLFKVVFSKSMLMGFVRKSSMPVSAQRWRSSSNASAVNAMREPGLGKGGLPFTDQACCRDPVHHRHLHPSE